MKKLDLYIDHGEVQAGGDSQAAAVDPDGVSPGELLDRVSAGGLVKFYVQTVLQAAGLTGGLAWDTKRLSRDVDLLKAFKSRAIKVTDARRALSGPLMEKAQENIQIIKNERTKKEALLLSEDLLEELLEGQAREMASEILRMKDELREKDEARLAAQSRQSFLDMTKSMETIKADVPIVEGTQATTDVPL